MSQSQLPPGFQPPAGLDAPAQPGCLLYLLFAAAGAWVIVVSLLVQGIAWVTDQVLLIEGTPLPGWAWTAISLGHALLLALPVVPLALLSRAPRFRAVYQTWAWAIGFMALFSLARIFPITWTQAAALAQIILSLAATAALLALNRRQSPLAIRRTPLPIPIVALIFGMLMLAPWLYYGALGSPLDTLLGLLAGLSLGLFAGTLLDKCLIAPLSSNANRSGSDIPFGGTAAGIALLILVAGFGFGGTQLLLMLCIPALGFATMALGRAADPGRGWLPIVALVGLAVAAPLMLLDPDELMLILDPELNEIIGWMLRAAGLALLIAWALGLLLWAAGDRIRRAHPAGLAGSGLVAFSMLVFFAFSARAGFYGDRIFVILRDQADVSAAATISDREERLRTVYSALTQHADTTQADLRATLDQLGVDYQPYYLVNAIEVDGGPLLRAYLARRPEVDRILDSPRLRPLPAPVSPAPGQVRGTSGVLWNIRMIGADRVWEDFGITGEGIVVGQSDSGVAGEHPALRDGYRGRGGQDDYNWLDPWNHTVSPSDGGGHGTHTLGSAVGRGGIGIAPGAEWFGCVNLGRNLGNPALYLTCMQFMLAPYPQDGDPLKDGVPARAAHVINNSWGCPELEGCDPNALAPATGALRAAGIFVVASAGNEGPRCSSVDDPIAIYDTVFSVGAMDEFGDVASFSSRGPVTVDGSGRIKPDLLAPGVDIVSAWPDGGYEESSGTSMAGPHIAGVVALLWSAQPALIGDIDRTTEILIETAQPYTGEREGCFEGDIPNGAYGYGVVDVYAAVEAALARP